MSNQIHFSNIVWDTDGVDVGLPTEAMFDVAEDDEAIHDGVDFLSAKYGFCVLSYSAELATAPV